MRKIIAILFLLFASASGAAAEDVQFSPAVTLGPNTFGANQAITATTNGTLSLALTNSSNGTAASARLQAFNDAGNATQILETGSGFTPSGNNLANQGQLVSGGPGGLYINAGNASGPLTLAANGTTGLLLVANTGAAQIPVSLAIGGATIGSNALAVTGTSSLAGNLSLGPDAASPTGRTVSVPNVAAGTSNGAGANTVINLSQGTGTGIGGNLTINGAPHSTTGSTQNALTPILTLNGDTKLATFTGGISVSAGITSLNGGVQNGNSASGFGLSSAGASATVPTLYPNRADSTTGIGAQASGNMSAIVGGAENTRFSTNLVTLLGSVQLNVAAMTQTSTAQSGTACYNSGTGAVTYDATLGCLASLPELKDIRGPISNTLAVLDQIKPIWFSWKHSTPEWKGGDHDVQAGLNAREIAAIPLLGKNLTARDERGNLRGVRYMEMAAFNLAVEKDLKALVLKQDSELRDLRIANDNLARRVAALEHRR